MDRRTYLAALASGTAASAAGCLARLGVSGAPESNADGAAPANAERGVTVEAVDESGTDHDVAIDVEVDEPWVTPDHPAKLRVTTTNEGRRRDVSISEGQCCLFDRSGGASDPSGIWLHRPGSTGYIDRLDGRWTRDAPVDDPRAYPAYGCLSRTYGPGESVTNAYHVWDDYRVGGYYPPGTYRFAERVTVSEPDDGYGDEREEIAAFTWGFSLSVTER